jgi:hypothetical protein
MLSMHSSYSLILGQHFFRTREKGIVLDALTWYINGRWFEPGEVVD